MNLAIAIKVTTSLLFCCFCVANQDGSVHLELEPSKGGDKETLEADVVLVSAGA